MNIIETIEGTKYSLVKSSYGFEWTGVGQKSKLLSGTFLNIGDALLASKRYISSLGDDKQRLKYSPTEVEELDILTRKKELLDFAEKHGISVPPALTKPTQIKKMIRDNL